MNMELETQSLKTVANFCLLLCNEVKLVFLLFFFKLNLHQFEKLRCHAFSLSVWAGEASSYEGYCNFTVCFSN